MALTGAITGDTTLAAIALMANLAALAAAVAALRQVQQRAAQAAAARLTAEHLHAVEAQARTRVPGFAQAADAPPRTRRGNAADLARRDSPAVPRPGRPLPAGPAPARPGPRYAPTPPKRAGPGR